MARRDERQWRELIDRQRESGQSAASFCRQQGINPTYFSSKKRQLAESGSTQFLKVLAQPKALDDESTTSDHNHGGVRIGVKRLRIIDRKRLSNRPLDILRHE